MPNVYAKSRTNFNREATAKKLRKELQELARSNSERLKETARREGLTVAQLEERLGGMGFLSFF